MWRSRRPRRELRRDGPAEYRRGGPQVPMEEASAPGQRPAPSGSRRAATGVRNNRRVCSETVEDHDRRFWYRWPLTWRSSRAFTVLNTTQFHVRRPGTDLARRKPGVQIPSPPPPTLQVRASPASSRRRSLPCCGRAAAASSRHSAAGQALRDQATRPQASHTDHRAWSPPAADRRAILAHPASPGRPRGRSGHCPTTAHDDDPVEPTRRWPSTAWASLERHGAPRADVPLLTRRATMPTPGVASRLVVSLSEGGQ
jgi:hypothetical protein